MGEVVVVTRIMVFNHSKEILILIQEILTGEGYDVSLHSYSPHELEEVEAELPDLLILDCTYRDPDSGWDLLQQLKLKRSTAPIPVVITTTDPKKLQSRTGYLSSKRVALLAKPFDIDDLLDVVKQALKLGAIMPDPDEDLNK